MVAASRTYTCAQVSGEASHVRAQRKPKSLLNIYLLNEGPQNVNGNWWKHYQHCCNKKVWLLHYVALNACSETWTCYAGLVHCSVPKDICQEKKNALFYTSSLSVKITCSKMTISRNTFSCVPNDWLFFNSSMPFIQIAVLKHLCRVFQLIRRNFKRMTARSAKIR